MSGPVLIGLCFASAAFYVFPSVVMKLAGNTSFLVLVLVLPVCTALGLAAWFESLALPGTRLGIVLILILAFEVLITALVALALGEAYGPRELAGLVAILGGVVLLFGVEGSNHTR